MRRLFMYKDICYIQVICDRFYEFALAALELGYDPRERGYLIMVARLYVLNAAPCWGRSKSEIS